LISFLGQKKLDVYVKAKTNEIMNQIPTGEKTKNTTKLLSHFKSLERRFTSYYVATYLFPGQIEVKFDHLLYYRGIEPCEIRTVLDFERYEEEIREIENCYQTFMEEISEYAQKSGVNLLFGRANFMEKSEEKENDLRVIYWVRKNMFVKHGYMAAIEKKSFEGTLLEVTAWLIQNIKKEIGKKRLKPLLGD
jgi:hypothetical protein